MENFLFWYISIGLAGLVIGSFLNVVIYRLPIILKNNFINEYQAFQESQSFQGLEGSQGSQESQEGQTLQALEEQTSPCDTSKINLSLPRSFCPNCKKGITFWQNIPIISFLILKGKCYCCKTNISYRYPLVELTSVIVSVLALMHFGLSIKLCFILVFLWILIALFVIDITEFLLPDNLTLSLLWLGLLFNLDGSFQPLQNAVISTVLGYCSLLGIVKMYKFMTGKDGMGHGDIKLFAAFGAWFGWEHLPNILLFASLSGSILGLFYLYKNKYNKNTPIPFGPFLILGATIVLFVKF